MISEEKLFENLFDDPKIINVRLYNFGKDTLNRLTAANDGGDYSVLIDLLTPVLSVYGDRLGLLDISITLQKGTTITNDQVMESFKETMSDKEGAIANALGGRGTADYQQFYPHKITEYSSAPKTQMTILTNRVNAAATANAGALGASLTGLLQGFEAQWITSRTSQEQQMASVDDTRSDRGTDRVAVELALCKIVHSIATKFPGDVAACKDFFDFAKLTAISHRKSFVTSGGLLPGEIKTVANMELTDNMEIEVKNTDINSSIVLYLAPTASSQPGDKFVIIKATKGKRPKISQLGDVNNTFLLVKNMSAVNSGSYIVKIKGVKDSEDSGNSN